MKRDFPRYAIVVHFIGFFVQCPIMLQNNEGLLKETTESAPTPQFSGTGTIFQQGGQDQPFPAGGLGAL